MNQVCVTTSMGKRLIGKGMVHHPVIKNVLQKGRLVIIQGTTNGYVAEEILILLGQSEGFTRKGFRRGIVTAPGATFPGATFEGDVVIIDGQWQRGKTIFDVVDDLESGDVVLKGGNALDEHRQAAVFVQHPKGGTVLATLTAVIGRRVRLIVPIGLEKRVFENVVDLAQQTNAPDVDGLRLMPLLGEVFTEIDAIKLITGAETRLLGAGGIYGAEGSVWLGISGTSQEVQGTNDLINSISNEPACQV